MFRKSILSLDVLLSVVNLFVKTKIVNLGEPGFNSNQVKYLYDTKLLKFKPELIIIMCGTNDALNSLNAVPIEQFKNNLSSMIKEAQNNNLKIIIAEIPDAYQVYVAPRHKKGYFNTKSAKDRIVEINSIVNELGQIYSIPVLKTNKILGEANADKSSLIRNKANSNAEDGIHPVAKGYTKIAENLLKIIKDNNYPTGRIVCLGDSITFGVHVKRDEAYPAQLQTLLNKQK